MTSRPAPRSPGTAPSLKRPARRSCWSAPLSLLLPHGRRGTSRSTNSPARSSRPLRQQYPGAFGGVMGWEFAYDQGGTWADGVGASASPAARVLPGTRQQRAPRLLGSRHGARAPTGQWTSDGQVAGSDRGHAAGRASAARVLPGHRPQRAPCLLGSRRGDYARRVSGPPTARSPGTWPRCWTAPRSTCSTGAPTAMCTTSTGIPPRGYAPTVWTSDGQVASDVATLLAGAQQHVFYTGTDGNVHHVYWDPAAGLSTDGQWTSDGQVAADRGHAAGRRPAARVLHRASTTTCTTSTGIPPRGSAPTGSGPATARSPRTWPRCWTAPAARVLPGHRRQCAPRLLGSRQGAQR